MEAEHVAELRELFDRDYRDIILDLRDLKLADRMTLENCPPYIRQWIDREKD